MTKPAIGILGAASLVGDSLLPLLTDDGWQVTAYSRKRVNYSHNQIKWLNPSQSNVHRDETDSISYWLCLTPIWVLPDYFEMFKSHGAKRIVALSSTSRFSKMTSTDAKEQILANRMAAGEEALQTWAEANNIEWIVLRPTLIYGYGKDKNISEIARFIASFGFFPLLGAARGLRQPIHVDDVASSCLAALTSPLTANHAYNISGGETLSYKEMIIRVFIALKRRPRLMAIPLSAFRFAIACLRLIPRFRTWSASMAERMNNDLVFDHSEASKAFNFSPRPFRLSAHDLPQRNRS